MRLKQIEDFIRVIEAGSIHAAARKLGISQPAVTKSVRALETELDVQLVRRTNHGIIPTPAGRAFFARVRAAHSELRKAKEEVAQFEGEGSVAFGVGPTVGMLIVPDAIAEFRRKYPGARVRIMEGLPIMLLPLVRDETLDFATGGRPDGKLDPALAFRPLFHHDFVVVARNGHPLRNSRSLAELREADWLSIAPYGFPGGPLERMFSAAGLPTPKQTIQCESYHIVVAVLSKTDMLGIITSRLLAAPFARDLLQQIPVAAPLPSYTAGLFTRRDSALTPVAAAMAKAVMMAARRLARPA